VILSCVIAWNGFASPAFAASDSVGSFINGFWQAFGGVVGMATGTVVTCYAVDVLIAPVAPPVAAYLATMCPAIGATVGGFGGVAGAKAIAGAH
jgi:hypothetical protein